MASDGSSKDPPGEEVALTCDALCSLGNSGQPKNTECSKHLQLPMFLTSTSTIIIYVTAFTSSFPYLTTACRLHRLRLPTETYHMIERCESDIAGWSEAGDNFTVKNLDKFANVRQCGAFILPAGCSPTRRTHTFLPPLAPTDTCSCGSRFCQCSSSTATCHRFVDN
jgi:hypothetical protein